MPPPLAPPITPCDRIAAATFVACRTGFARHAAVAPTARPAVRATSACELAERKATVAAGLPAFAFVGLASSQRAAKAPAGRARGGARRRVPP